MKYEVVYIHRILVKTFVCLTLFMYETSNLTNTSSSQNERGD